MTLSHRLSRADMGNGKAGSSGTGLGGVACGGDAGRVGAHLKVVVLPVADDLQREFVRQWVRLNGSA